MTVPETAAVDPTEEAAAPTTEAASPSPSPDETAPATVDLPLATAETVSTPEEAIAAFRGHLKRAEEQLEPIHKLRLPRFLKWSNFIWPFLVVGGAASSLGLVIGWPAGITVGVLLAIGLAAWVRITLVGKLKGQLTKVYPPYQETVNELEKLLQKGREMAKATFERRKVEVEQNRETALSKAEEKLERATAQSEQRRADDTKQADEKYPPLVKAAEERRNQAMQQADDRYPRRLAELKAKFEADTKQINDNYQAQKEATEKGYKDAWNALTRRWTDGLANVDSIAQSINEESRRLFYNWEQTEIEDWPPPSAVPPALRFGEFTIDLKNVEYGITRDPRLKGIGPTRHTLPALLPFPKQGSLLLKAGDGSGRAAAIPMLQAVMLRYLTSIPPGKVRFTIVDPVGLGENFAAFMHLGDYSEMLINSRIWTETPHIDHRLTDLSEHMENVIQKYLRNDFQTIEEYNIHAGEVAEPFRILVVANFPVNFSEQAARRLISIASTGARCGVYTLVSADLKQQMPTGCELKNLEPYCTNLMWRDGAFAWREPNFSQLPLQLDAPPPADKFSKILHDVGEKARNANKVEVPFEFIAPPIDQYWTQDSSKGVDIPLGRAGATKLQSLKLGKGTSQHVLTAGKTGSGKSTLLHAMITNAALRYSPDQVELYLIDFKKGVEFKVYATRELPHAKVIAVESEREFGLSVLQRLDVELKVRGDRFRDMGVQDLNGFRQATAGKVPLPRILLIVDEFQEFFVEDDKIAQEVSLLLDRLVRQGRAFGVHVILGSQTLSGSFSLPRSTLGQMAVRIALQCSEADAHMILSEDNGAARLLTRPGEAIYNDANGMMEGNNFFQVVLLSDTSREKYLEQLQELSKKQGRPPVSQIVFEGNLPAVLGKNYLLNRLLEVPEWPEPPKADYAWLGDAIAIKDPTAAVFRPQSGSNVMMVGQNDEGALGMFASAMISLATQHPPAHSDRAGSGVRFYLLDGTPVDSPNNGLLAKVASALPHSVRQVTWRELAGVMSDLATEVDRRQKSASGEVPNIYLFVFDLQRFRDLRKADDDFGFSSSRYGEEKAASPSKNFATILREGPPVGVHTMFWCDSLNNLNRTFDRQGLKEFEIRILFQMSQNDSSSLIDSPAAGKIGEHRALYFSEEEGKFEKFRPYGFPDDELLAQVRQHLSSRPIPEAPPEPEPVDEPAPAHEPAAPDGPPPPPRFEMPAGLTLEPLGTSSVYGNWAPLKTIEIPDDVNFDEEPAPKAPTDSAEAPSGDGNGTAAEDPSPNPTEVKES